VRGMSSDSGGGVLKIHAECEEKHLKGREPWTLGLHWKDNIKVVEHVTLDHLPLDNV